jgi:hypothetical protein
VIEGMTVQKTLNFTQSATNNKRVLLGRLSSLTQYWQSEPTEEGTSKRVSTSNQQGKGYRVSK